MCDDGIQSNEAHIKRYSDGGEREREGEPGAPREHIERADRKGETGIAPHDVLFNPDIVNIIFSFSSLQDASRAREVCRMWADVLPRISLHNLPDWRGSGLYVDAEQILHTLPPFPADVQKIAISLKTRHPGTGRKGAVWFTVSEPARFVSNIVAKYSPFDAVVDGWREDRATIDTTTASEFIQKALVGTHVTVWAHVGAAGGQLNTKEFSIHYKPSAYQSAQTSKASTCSIM